MMSRQIGKIHMGQGTVVKIKFSGMEGLWGQKRGDPLPPILIREEIYVNVRQISLRFKQFLFYFVHNFEQFVQIFLDFDRVQSTY